jgi:hypothetical protein
MEELAGRFGAVESCARLLAALRVSSGAAGA